ncbi:MAG: hypothetical protein AAFR90_11950 [Pseudomonadota bacterium]
MNRPKSIQRVVDEVSATLNHHGLSCTEFALIARQSAKTGEYRLPQEGNLEKVLNHGCEVLSNERTKVNTQLFSQFVQIIDELLEETIDRTPLRSMGHFIRHVARNIFAIFLFIAAFYIILGGILDGKSSFEFAAESPLLGMLLFLVCLAGLGSLEGTQISVVELKNTDRFAFASMYPRAARFQGYGFREVDVQQYLAGRQFFVIVIVFFMSRVTSFPEYSTLPFTDFNLKTDLFTPAGIPEVVPDSIYFVFMQAGVLGALLVLWVAQLFPQFLANRNAYWLASFPGMIGVVRFCKSLERTGVTDPGSWLVKLIPPGPHFPASTRQLLKNDLTARGLAEQGIKKTWTLTPSSAASTEEQTSYISGDVSTIRHRARFEFDNSPRLTANASLIRSQNGAKATDLYLDTSEQIAEGSDARELLITSSPLAGNFQPGDVVMSTTDVTYDFDGEGNFTEIIPIDAPMKYLIFSINTHDDLIVSGVTYKIKMPDTATQNWITRKQGTLVAASQKDGFQQFEYAIVYPIVGARYEFSWSVKTLKAIAV